jgi:hypothetical protein
LTGSSTMTASSSCAAEAASIQWPFQPAARSLGRPRWCSRRPGGDDDVAALERAMSLASCSSVSFLAWAGPCRRRSRWRRKRLDQAEVAFGRMRSISTEPTMPRQPTKPTRFLLHHIALSENEIF